MMSKIVSGIGAFAGFAGNTISYTLRYMAANSLDSTSFSLSTSDYQITQSGTR